MRVTEASGWMVRTQPWRVTQSWRLTRSLWLATALFGIGLVMAAGPVRAADAWRSRFNDDGGTEIGSCS